jgi:hypothetical protein
MTWTRLIAFTFQQHGLLYFDWMGICLSWTVNLLCWAGLGWARCTLLRGSCEAPAKLVLGSC